MSGPFEKYVAQAAKAAADSRAPVWRWDYLTDSERESRIGQMRAALAAVGPLIQEDARERMVAAAGAALEREGAGCGCEQKALNALDLDIGNWVAHEVACKTCKGTAS